MISPLVSTLILAIPAAVATGLMGGFAHMKRMTLAGDTMSHIALPGIGLALLWGLHPLLGAAVTLLLGAFIIWKIERISDVPSENIIGVVFATSLAIGTLVTPSEDLIDALFGGGGAITLPILAAYLAIAVAIIAFLWFMRDRLILALFNKDLATVTGVNVSRLNLLFLLAFAATLVLGLRFLGALLVGALVIIPPAIARQFTHTLRAFLFVSVIASVLAVVIGYALSIAYGWQAGPTIVTVAAVGFLGSLLKQRT